MASKKKANRHQEIDRTVDDPAERAARVQEETSNDGRFSTYERVPGRFPEDGDLIVQYRGAPSEAKR
jgi:hypothetical protein